MPRPVTAPFRYYGGKGRLAPWIVSLMPPHDAYIEPFLGAGAVLFAKSPVRHELVNDLDGMVTNFFEVLRDRCDELVEACRQTPYARDEFNACRDRYGEPGDPLERARRFFVVVVPDWRYGVDSSDASGPVVGVAGMPHPRRTRQPVDVAVNDTERTR